MVAVVVPVLKVVQAVMVLRAVPVAPAAKGAREPSAALCRLSQFQLFFTLEPRRLLSMAAPVAKV
jgi:hypothetical protein